MIKLQRNKKEGDPAFKVWVRKKKKIKYGSCYSVSFENALKSDKMI